VRAHVEDLRAEVDKDESFRGLDADDVAARGAAAAEDPRLAGLLAYAEKLTRTPGDMSAADVDALRALGYEDRAIHDAAQVAGYFAYINRVADGLGVDLEPEMEGGPR